MWWQPFHMYWPADASSCHNNFAKTQRFGSGRMEKGALPYHFDIMHFQILNYNRSSKCNHLENELNLRFLCNTRSHPQSKPSYLARSGPSDTSGLFGYFLSLKIVVIQCKYDISGYDSQGQARRWRLRICVLFEDFYSRRFGSVNGKIGMQSKQFTATWKLIIQ